MNSKTRRSILITGGGRGVIRLIEPEQQQIDDKHGARHFIGHGGAVNQLKIAPHQPYLLASASSDRSVRLWNIETMVCIASFHGENGHRDDIVTIDFNRDATKLVSGGTDHMLAIWDLTEPSVANAIKNSRDYNAKREARGFKTALHMYPIFRSRQIHCNYIDCVQWINELILSKVSVLIFLSPFAFAFAFAFKVFGFSCLIRSQMSMICIAGHHAQTNYHEVGLPQTPLSINLILSRIFRCLSVDIILCVLQPMPRNR